MISIRFPHKYHIIAVKEKHCPLLGTEFISSFPTSNKPAARHQFKVPGGLIISNIQLIQNFYFLIVTVLVGLHVE